MTFFVLFSLGYIVGYCAVAIAYSFKSRRRR